MSLTKQKLYYPWVDDAYSADTAERKACAEHVLSFLANKGTEGKKLADSLVDAKEFAKLSFVGYLNYIDLHHNIAHEICNIAFTAPTIALKHRKLPLIVIVSEEKIPEAKYIKIKENKKSLGVTQLLSYIDVISQMDVEEKNKLYALCIEGIRVYRKEKKSDKWLSDYLDSGKDFNFLGFSANFPYINVDPKFGDTKSLWIHAWGTPQLLFQHKQLPVMMIVGPSVRLDENVLGERNMLGFTG